jgi:hypothetical protein
MYRHCLSLNDKQVENERAVEGIGRDGVILERDRNRISGTNSFEYWNTTGISATGLRDEDVITCVNTGLGDYESRGSSMRGSQRLRSYSGQPLRRSARITRQRQRTRVKIKGIKLIHKTLLIDEIV